MRTRGPAKESGVSAVIENVRWPFLFRAANLSGARAGERPVLISGNPAELIR